MTTAPDPRTDDSDEENPHPARSASHAALVFDDPLDQRSADDSDSGWGERPGVKGGSAADLARFLDEKPPHHI